LETYLGGIFYNYLVVAFRKGASDPSAHGSRSDHEAMEIRDLFSRGLAKPL
jgi:hypothetical protein